MPIAAPSDPDSGNEFGELSTDCPFGGGPMLGTLAALRTVFTWSWAISKSPTSAITLELLTRPRAQLTAWVTLEPSPASQLMTLSGCPLMPPDAFTASAAACAAATSSGGGLTLVSSVVTSTVIGEPVGWLGPDVGGPR